MAFWSWVKISFCVWSCGHFSEGLPAFGLVNLYVLFLFLLFPNGFGGVCVCVFVCVLNTKNKKKQKQHKMQLTCLYSLFQYFTFGRTGISHMVLYLFFSLSIIIFPWLKILRGNIFNDRIPLCGYFITYLTNPWVFNLYKQCWGSDFWSQIFSIFLIICLKIDS